MPAGGVRAPARPAADPAPRRRLRGLPAPGAAADLREGLPAIDTGWGDFGEAVGDDGGAAAATPPPTATPGSMDEYRRKPKEEVGVRGQVVFRRQIEALGAEPSLNFIHVKLPHNLYGLTPRGEGTLPVAQRPDGSRIDPEGGAARDPAHDFLFRLIYPIQAMQLGAVDALVGEMIDRLESTGAWDEAPVVVNKRPRSGHDGAGFHPSRGRDQHRRAVPHPAVRQGAWPARGSGRRRPGVDRRHLAVDDRPAGHRDRLGARGARCTTAASR